MAEQEQWQLAGRAAELYEEHLVPAMTSLWAADLVERVGLRPGERVLDVACGTGVVARAAADRVGAGGRVVAVDVNASMLDVARSLPPVSGAAIDWRLGDVLALPFAAAEFDVVLCQLGLQFFPDRPLALREVRRVLVPDGRLGLNVFGPIEHNPATHALSDALDRCLHPGASLAKRIEHALADTEALRDLLAGAGFRDVVIRTATKRIRFESPTAYVRVQLSATPLAALVAEVAPAARDGVVAAVVEDVGAALARYVGEHGLAFPQEVHVALATR